MNEKNKAVIQFIGYRVTDISYKCNAAFQLPQGEISYKFNFNKNNIKISPNEIQENVRVNVFYSEDEDIDTAPYRLTVEIAGRFSCESEWQSQWETNAIAIMFPYLRSIVSIITSNSGREPIILPTINLVSLFGM